MCRALDPTNCLPHKDDGTPLSAFPKEQIANIPAFSSDISFSTKRPSSRRLSRPSSLILNHSTIDSNPGGYLRKPCHILVPQMISCSSEIILETLD